MDYSSIAKEVFKVESAGLKEVGQKLSKDFDQIITEILKTKGRCVVTGMGKSGIVGKKISATLASTGTRSFFMHPAEAFHGDLGMLHADDIIIAISNSGETEEIIKLLPFFKRNNNTVIALANNAQSTLAKHTNYFLDIGVTEEACPLALAPTTSTTVTMAMGDAIAVALMRAREFKAENFAQFHPGGSLGRKLLSTVSDLMKKENLPTVKMDATFDEIIDVISSGRLGMSVVLEGDEVVGVITDGDIRRVLKSKKEAALKLTSKDFYTADPVLVQADVKIIDAEMIMQDKKISTLIVVQEKKLIGVLHRYDI